MYGYAQEDICTAVSLATANFSLNAKNERIGRDRRTTPSRWMPERTLQLLLPKRGVGCIILNGH